jgi:hypothetical protein
MDNDELIKQYIFNICAEKPYLLPDIIKAATAGVQQFANNQSDKSSKLAFVMSQILDECPQKQFGSFSRAEILDRMDCLKGTVWMDEELKGLTV